MPAAERQQFPHVFCGGKNVSQAEFLSVWDKVARLTFAPLGKGHFHRFQKEENLVFPSSL